MTPIDEARAVYLREPCRRTFEVDLELHLQNGYVFSTPKLFLMGRPVLRIANPEDIVNPAFIFEHYDAWLIYLAAGDFREFFRFEPFPLKWYGWERENMLRFFLSSTVKRCANRTSDAHFEIRPSHAVLQGRREGTPATAPTGTNECSG